MPYRPIASYPAAARAARRAAVPLLHLTGVRLSPACVKFTIESFFSLPTLTRYRFVTGVGAVALVLGAVLRYFVESPESGLQPTRLAAAASLGLMALLSPYLRYARSNPHAVGYVSALPLLAHVVWLMHITNLEPSTAVSGAGSAVVSAAID